MKFSVVTSMNQSYYDRVGKVMVDSFLANWDEEINLQIYTEDSNFKLNHPRIEVLLLQEDQDYVDFHERHKDRKESPNALHDGALRFSHKVFAVLNGSEKVRSDFMVWLDADTRTFAKVTKDWLSGLVEVLSHVTYLGRQGNYTECGFVIYNLTHSCNKEFMHRWRQYYVEDTLFKLSQWHDCVAFDVLRQQFEKIGVTNINLSPNGKGYDHVFINSVLGEKMDHMKGARKDRGKSDTSDLTTERKEEYWS